MHPYDMGFSTDTALTRLQGSSQATDAQTDRRQEYATPGSMANGCCFTVAAAPQGDSPTRKSLHFAWSSLCESS